MTIELIIPLLIIAIAIYMVLHRNDKQIEIARQRALDSFKIHDLAQTAFSDLTRLAADIFQVPVAFVTFIDGSKQIIKSGIGSDVTETERAVAFCDHTIRKPNDVLVVEDATLDNRFKTNPLVTGDPNIRFYAGAPLTTSTGLAIGSICVIASEPRSPTTEQLDTLKFLSKQVMIRLEEHNVRA